MSDDNSKYFSADPLSESENQEARNMLSDWSEHSPRLIAMSNLIKSGKTLALFIGTVAVIGGAIAWAVEKGLF